VSLANGAGHIRLAGATRKAITKLPRISTPFPNEHVLDLAIADPVRIFGHC